MNRILIASIRLSLCALLLVVCPLFARKSQPAKIKAAAIEVQMIQSDEIKLPAEFQIALYENLIRQLHKQGFSQVYREGDRSAASVNLKSTSDFAKKAAHVAHENFSSAKSE